LLAEPLDVAERLELGMATRPRQLTGAIVFNVAIKTDFPGHVRFDGHTLVMRNPMRLQLRAGRKLTITPGGGWRC
jgi:hypothetical protein